MDDALIGCWRVTGSDMVVGRSVRLIGGLLGEFGEFTADGRYRVDLADRRPLDSRYRTSATAETMDLDIWIEGLETLGAHCIYRIDGDTLAVCIAGDSRPRPTELRRDDGRLWCVMIFERSVPPKRRRSARSELLLEPGSLIQKAFLKKPGKRLDSGGVG